MDDQYLTARQVSELFQLKIKTVYAAAADGRLPSVCLWKGKRKSVIRSPRSEIERLLKKRMRQG